MIGTALTTVIGLVAKGKAAKAMAGGAAGAILTAGQPFVDTFVAGFQAGALPEVKHLGVILGQAIAGYVVGYAVTWFAPANKPA